MSDKFNLYDVYEQNLNFLFGAGASFGFLPTLALNIKDANGDYYTFETLAKDLESNKFLFTLLFMYYYKKCIQPGLPKLTNAREDSQRKKVLTSYKTFLQTLLVTLEKQNKNNKKCNIYTTNYDNCFELSADDLLSEQAINCIINDGSSGFQKRKFHTKNFNNRVIQKGIFEKHNEYIPQINILHPHGSVYWQKDKKSIEVNYGDTKYDINLNSDQQQILSSFENIITNSDKSLHDLIQFDNEQDWHAEDFAEDFWNQYELIPIVNPTKWKFHETVFEEAYYQILRHFSFELERPNTVLVTFGFSFADEHILSLVQRSLSNPSLTVYISCFNEAEKNEMKKKFKGHNNVKYISIDDDLTFTRFNKRVFTLKKDET